jgi:hypothetical protein
MKTSSKVFLSLLLIILSISLTAQNSQTRSTASAAVVIAEIIKNTGAETIRKTVDIIKEGDPETPVKGIVTSMFATMDVLKQAVSKNCNLIIVHEPLFYNHLDETKQFQDDPVFLEKQRYINDHKLVIWRFHDYIHRMKPDGIGTGMVSKLGWKDYEVNGSTDQFVLPETTLIELLKKLKLVFPKNAFYVIGKPEMKLSGVRFAAGAPGSSYHIRLLEEKSTDLVIAGESPQWETYEYMRDAVEQGRKKAIIPVYFIESGPSYWSY